MSIKYDFPAVSPSLNLDFVKSKKIDPRGTFTRVATGSVASYMDHQGLIKYAGPDEPRFNHKIVKRTNFALNGITFTSAVWNHQRVTVTTGAADGPSYGSIGTKIQGDGSAGGAMSVYQTFTDIEASEQYRISVFAKAGDAKWLKIEAYDLINNPGAFFNLETGEVGSSTNPILMSDLTMEYYGDGWWRCSCVRLLDSSADRIRPQFTLATGNNTISTEDTKYFYLWGAQLERGSALPTEFIRTQDAPVTVDEVVPQGLLIEEASSNKALYTQRFHTGWTPANGTLTTDQATAPTGENTATLFTQTGASTAYIQQGISYTAGTYYTFSSFVKKYSDSDVNEVYILVYGATFHTDGVSNCAVKFNLDRGTSTIALGTVYRHSIEPWGDGWWRISATFLANVTETRSQQHLRFTDPGQASNLYIWGGMVSQEADLLSYIPSEASVITREKDYGVVFENDKFPDVYDVSKSTVVYEGQARQMEKSPLTAWRIADHFSPNLRGIGLQIDSRVSSSSDGAAFSWRDEASGITNTEVSADGNFFIDFPDGTLKTATTWNYNTTPTSAVDGVIKPVTAYNWPSILQTEDRLDIGHSKGISGSNGSFTGHAKYFQYYPSEVSYSNLVRLSSR